MVARFRSETISEKQQATCREIRLGLDLIVAALVQGEVIVTEHGTFMPWYDAVADFMGFVPAMLQLRLLLIE